MKLHMCLLSFVLILVLLCGCTHGAETITAAQSGAVTEEASPTEKRLIARSSEIAGLYRDIYCEAEKTESEDLQSMTALSQGSIDAMENRLSEAGIVVMDSTEKYPSYLPTPESFFAFLDSVRRGTPAEYEFVSIADSGDLSYCLFDNTEKGLFLHTAYYRMAAAQCRNFETHEVLDWTLTEKKNFFYRIYPAGNKHYADYTLIRTAPPDTELWDLTFRYIYPAGYTGTNIFLMDWEEGNWGELSFNDVWEYLYRYNNADQYYSTVESFAWEDGRSHVPAAIFEETVLPYFDLEVGDLRSMAQYSAEADGYPWRQILTNDFVFLKYYTCEPQVTAYSANPDGTVTLTVEMLSTDLKLDCLFAHAVTVRPLSDGTFQYVGNKIVFQREYGLPYGRPRSTWGAE